MKNLKSTLFIFPVIFCLAVFGYSFTHHKKTGIKIGDTAPEIVLNDPQGKVLKLSSLRGKYVILDFWASWCGPCRLANPDLVQTYRKYYSKVFQNGSGLAIYSVSLDKDKESWTAAIKSDNLYWQE